MSRKIILIGCGGVGKTFLEMLPMTRHISAKEYAGGIVIIEPTDLSGEPTIKALKDKGIKVKIIQKAITPVNVDKLMLFNIATNDIVIDVSYNVSYEPLLRYCLSNDVYYINTSVERWELKDEHKLDTSPAAIYKRTLHSWHEHAREIAREHKKPNSTILFTHGMNPGLITHFTHIAILKVAKQVLLKAKSKGIATPKVKKLLKAYKAINYAQMAYIMGLEVIHCSERDTQVPYVKRKSNEFMNTWGPYSLYSEGVDPVQLGWGTHEKAIADSIKPPTGEKNQIFMKVRGIDMQCRSYVPLLNNMAKGHIVGMAVSHSENDTLCRSLTVYDSTGKVKYRPSNYYVYSPCVDAWESIKQVKKNKYHMLEKQVALRGSDIKTGEDAVGALLIFRNNPIDEVLYEKQTNPVSYWSGSILSIQQTRKLGLKYAGPTTVQVGISLLSAIKWMLENKPQGLIFPEDVPSEYIMANAKKYLGTIFTGYVPFEFDSTIFVNEFLTSYAR